MTNYFYDTEFYEDGKQVHLISLGMVCEDGRELYLQNSEFNWDIVPDDHWIQENVRPWLHTEDIFFHDRAEIADILRGWVLPEDGQAQLWGYYSAYDHVVLAQIFGIMMNLPGQFPMYTRDLKQWADHLYIRSHDYPVQDEVQHHALADARWNQKLWRFLDEIAFPEKYDEFGL
jgi:hypothetical protein